MQRQREADQFWALSVDLLAVADYEGRLLRVSPSWLSLIGQPEIALLSGDYIEITHPDDIERSMAAVGKMRVGQVPVLFENRILGADGSWQIIAWSLSPIPGGENFIAIGRNITHERKAETALSDTQDFVRLALSAVGGVGVWTYDVRSDTFVCDAAVSALYALDPERGAAGFKRAEFLANVLPDDVSPLRATMTGGLERPGDLELEYRIQHPDGSIRWVLSRGHTYFDDEGVAVRRTGVGIDMTRQRLLEEQLRQAQKMEALGQLTGGIAHDFNNLLTVIRGSADLLRRPNVPETKRLVYIDAVADTADRSQFDTAVVNMAVNARDAMDGAGRLTITVGVATSIPAVRGHLAVDGKFVTVSLTDTGAGIPPDGTVKPNVSNVNFSNFRPCKSCKMLRFDRFCPLDSSKS